MFAPCHGWNLASLPVDLLWWPLVTARRLGRCAEVQLAATLRTAGGKTSAHPQ